MFSDHPNDWLLDVSECFSYLLSPGELFHILSFLSVFVNVVLKSDDEVEIAKTKQTNRKPQHTRAILEIWI